jgi:hypothetical protein
MMERGVPVQTMKGIRVDVALWVAQELDAWSKAHGDCSRASVLRTILEGWAREQVRVREGMTTEAA